MPLNPLDQAKYLKTEGLRRGGATLIERADEEVPIREVLALYGIHIPHDIVMSWKTPCPWGAEHEDGGLDPNCRVYTTNNLYCFAMHGSQRPSQIYARRVGVSRKRAAIMLLEERGLLRPLSYQERWEEARQRREASTVDLGTSSDMVAALQRAMETDAVYVAHELDPEIQDVWGLALSALDAAFTDPNAGVESLTEWLAAWSKRLHDTAAQLTGVV